MPSVFRLAYVDLATPSVDAAQAYYDGVLGATTVERSAGAAYLSLGLDHHNLALSRAERPGLDAIGLQVGPGVELPDLKRRSRISGSARKAGAIPGPASAGCWR